MNISDYIKREKARMREKSRKERIVYFWDYYKWHVMVAGFIILLLTQTFFSLLTDKDVALKGILIDGIPSLEESTYTQEFMKANGIDPARNEIILDTGPSFNSDRQDLVSASYQMIHACIGAEDTDFIVGYEYAIQRLSYDTSGMFADLRDVFNSDTLADVEEYIYYIDGSVLEKIKQSSGEQISLPDPRKPEGMIDPIPIALNLSACSEFQSEYYSDYQDVYLAVTINSPHMDLTVRFVEFLF